MRITPWSWHRVALVLVPLACAGDNVIGPDNQLQVTNTADNFQFQVSNLNMVTQTLTYSWTNTGDSANVNQSSSLVGGAASLAIQGPTGNSMYSSNLQTNGTFHTVKGTSGAWQIIVVLNSADGNINFRVQKAP